jgi:predicted subunit of tRNA(5-methylaminomethyl-2-thiouridylate) methyltransferase
MKVVPPSRRWQRQTRRLVGRWCCQNRCTSGTKKGSDFYLEFRRLCRFCGMSRDTWTTDFAFYAFSIPRRLPVGVSDTRHYSVLPAPFNELVLANAMRGSRYAVTAAAVLNTVDYEWTLVTRNFFSVGLLNSHSRVSRTGGAIRGLNWSVLARDVCPPHRL